MPSVEPPRRTRAQRLVEPALAQPGHRARGRPDAGEHGEVRGHDVGRAARHARVGAEPPKGATTERTLPAP